MVRDFFDFLNRTIPINDPYVFLGLSAAVVAYLLYITVARRRGDRPGDGAGGPDL